MAGAARQARAAAIIKAFVRFMDRLQLMFATGIIVAQQPPVGKQTGAAGGGGMKKSRFDTGFFAFMVEPSGLETADLRVANAPLSQLSYGPMIVRAHSGAVVFIQSRSAKVNSAPQRRRP